MRSSGGALMAILHRPWTDPDEVVCSGAASSSRGTPRVYCAMVQGDGDKKIMEGRWRMRRRQWGKQRVPSFYKAFAIRSNSHS